MKRGLLISLVVAVAAFATVGVVVANNTQPTYDIRLIVAHDPAPAYYMKAMKNFADTVESETGGHVRVQVLTGSQYGTIDMAQLRDALAAGKFEMSATTTSSLGRLENDFWVYEMPYIFQSYDQVARTIDGPIGQRLMDKLPAHGLRGLAYTYSGGFKIVCSNSAALDTPSAFVGLNVLTQDPVNMSFFKSMGAHPVKGSYRNSKEYLSTNKVQATEMTLTRYKEYGLSCKYVNELDHSFFLTTLLINDAYYQKLPVAYRDVIAKAARQVAIEERANTVREIQAIRTAIKAKGIHVVTLTPDQKAQFRLASRRVYGATRNLFTPGLVSEILSNRVAVNTH